MNRRNFLLVAATFAGGFGSNASAAQTQLRLGGDIDSGTPAYLGEDDLLALPQTQFVTSTPWTTSEHQFSGPTLADLLDHFGAGPGDLKLGAINDYTVTVERDLVTKEAPIIANRIDGQPFGRREKGPLWIVFPYDHAFIYQREVVFAASVWQLSQITVLDG